VNLHDSSRTAELRSGSSAVPHPDIRGAFLDSFSILRIDGREVSYILHEGERIVLKPGPHRIIVRASYLQIYIEEDMPYDGYDTLLEVNATLEAGHKYICNGRVGKSKVYAWIEDAATREKMCPTAESSLPPLNTSDLNYLTRHPDARWHR
jgi:hypothetical protein